jgi:hypothetical protein
MYIPQSLSVLVASDEQLDTSVWRPTEPAGPLAYRYNQLLRHSSVSQYLRKSTLI